MRKTETLRHRLTGQYFTQHQQRHGYRPGDALVRYVVSTEKDFTTPASACTTKRAALEVASWLSRAHQQPLYLMDLFAKVGHVDRWEIQSTGHETVITDWGRRGGEDGRLR
jgi:hypothetical protein